MNSTYRERMKELLHKYKSDLARAKMLRDHSMEVKADSQFAEETIALIQEVAKSAKPAEWETPDRRAEPTNRQIGYKEGIDQYEQNIKELLGGSSEYL